MKLAILTLLLLAAVITGVFWGSHAASEAIEELIQRAQELPGSPSLPAVDELLALWDKKESSLILTINKSELSEVDDRLAALRGAAIANDCPRFLTERERVIRAFMRLQDATDYGIRDIL